MNLRKMIREFKCNKLDWHNPEKFIEFDGINYCSKCKHCGREILQDSQGNWFKIK